MSIDFYTSANMGLFWDYVKMLLSAAAPGVLIVFSLVAVGWLLKIIITAFKQSSNDEDDDDDFETRHY